MFFRNNGPCAWCASLAVLAVASVGLFSRLAPAADVQQEEEAVRVYKQLKPSVVSLQNAEGSGTGVIVGTDGLVLTNAHVVSSPLPFEMKVEVEDKAGGAAGGATRTVTFKHVEVTGYHAKLDLALVRVDPKELRDAHVTLKPAVISKTKADTGQRVYVVGDPAGGNTVLTKTITSGMLSAVDREFDGERYYQTDAAINPGNSGGPMCDRNGKVLGLVTFKFTDVQAIGFAIPLHDVDLKAFVSLTERKSDPKRASELMKVADQYLDLAERTGKREGLNSPTYLRLSMLAAMCYRMALADDPANAALYVNIGVLLRTIDDNAVGAAYIARGLALEPWDAGGNPYRELGFSLVKQEKKEPALTAWHEGLAKEPYNSKIWEDLAIYHITNGQPADAAEAAAMAILISERDTRVQVMRQVVKDARAKVADDARAAAELERRVERPKLIAKLDEMLAASNKARAARKAYLTAPFVSLMTAMGGPPVKGVEQRIPQTPIKRLAEFDQSQVASSGAGAGPGTGSATTQSPAAPKAAAPPAGKSSGNAAKPSPGNGATAAAPDDWLAPAKPDAKTDAKGKPGDKGKPDDKSGAAGQVKGNAKPNADVKTAKAPDDWLGAGTVGGGAASVTGPLPEPTLTGAELGLPARQVVDAEVVALDPKGVKDVVQLEWSADAKFAFILQRDGVLRKVAVPSMKEERQVALKAKCSAIGRCSLGLVVAVEGLQEVWLLDDDLKTRKRVTATGVAKIAASPALPVVFAAGGGDRLTVLDVAAGRPVQQITPRDIEEQRGSGDEASGLGFGMFALTPDGKYFFCEGRHALHRLRVAGNRLVHEERGPDLGGNPQKVIVSPDSKYVAMPCGGGNGPMQGFPKMNYGTYVFRVGDLKTPVMSIESGAYPRALGFDAVAKCVYAQSYDKALIVYAPTGIRGKEYKLSSRRGGGGETDRFYVHPAGKRTFVLAGGHLYWFTLP